MEKFDEWVAFRFEWTCPWKKIDVNSNKEVWTNWYGIPIHTWSSKFFSLIYAQVGRFIKLDKNTEEKNNLVRVRILISAPILSQIDKILKMCIDRKV